MKFSDIRGRRSLEVMAEAMELVELMAGDKKLQGILDDIRQAEGNSAWLVFCKHVPKILRQKKYADRIMRILAIATDTPIEEYEQNGEVLKDLFELVLSDSDTLGFLSSSLTPQR